MTSHAPFDEIEEKPLDPAIERVRRRMMRLMLISIGIMMVGLMAVLFGIVYKLNSGSTAPAPTATDTKWEAVVTLPAGARIISQEISGDRLTLLIADSTGPKSLVLINLTTGQETGRISFAAP